MSGGSPTVGSDADADHESGPQSTASRVPTGTVGASLAPGRVAVAAGGVGVLALATRRTLEALANLPADPVAPSAARELLSAGVPVVLGFALVAVALVAARPSVRVGLLFAGVFGLLATVDRAATLPGVVAVVVGSAVALGGAVGRPSTYRAARRCAVAAAALVGLSVSLASSVGLVDGGLRAAGSLASLGALAAVGVRAEGDRAGLLAGAAALVAVGVASAASPFVVGSVALVDFAVVGTPHALVALAVAGGVAAVVAGVRRRDPALALGAALLLLAGVPATVPRALAVLLGAALALGGARVVDGAGVAGSSGVDSP